MTNHAGEKFLLSVNAKILHKMSDIFLIKSYTHSNFRKRIGTMSNIFFLLILFTSVVSAQLAGSPGAFSRMGFGARGMALGNAMTAVKNGEIPGFYNPAGISYLKNRNASVAYGILSLDRGLNSIFFSAPLDTTASVSFGILNAGVSDIDGRDADGFPTDSYSTSENMFSFSFSMRIRKISIGVSTKIYYYSLYNNLSSTGLGFDIGAVYPLTSNLAIGAVLKDLNAKYKWNTSDLYGELGNTTTDKFPMRRAVGISYALGDSVGLISAEIESSNKSTTVIRVGGEYTIVEQLTVRAGLDGWNLDDAKQAHPSFGFTLRSDLMDWNPALNYAYVIEPYGLFAIHVISLSVML